MRPLLWIVYHTGLCLAAALPLVWMEPLPGRVVCYLLWFAVSIALGSTETDTRVMWSITIAAAWPIAFAAFHLKSDWWLLPSLLCIVPGTLAAWRQAKIRAQISGPAALPLLASCALLIATVYFGKDGSPPRAESLRFEPDRYLAQSAAAGRYQLGSWRGYPTRLDTATGRLDLWLGPRGWVDLHEPPARPSQNAWGDPPAN